MTNVIKRIRTTRRVDIPIDEVKMFITDEQLREIVRNHFKDSVPANARFGYEWNTRKEIVEGYYLTWDEPIKPEILNG